MVFLVLILVASFSSPPGGGGPAVASEGLRPAGALDATQDKPAEEDRFDLAAFHNGLRQRGLTELLELHLKEFPPRNPESLLLLQRQVKLATYADRTLPDEVRRAALEEANRLLEELIAVRTIDPRRHQWRFDLVSSLIDEEAAPFISRVVLLGGNSEDRRELGRRTGRAVSILNTLTEQIAAEYERLDSLPLREYERIDQTGYVDRLETLEGKADYLTLWVLYYDALAREDGDPVRAGRLDILLNRLDEESWLLDTPHEQSHVQAQALLISGMASRLIGHYDLAQRTLARAVGVVQRIGDPAQRRSLAWAALWGTVERSRALRDGGRHQEAITALQTYRQRLAGSADDSFGVRLVLALAERSVHKVLAENARRKGDVPKAKEHQARALAVLLRLARRNAGNRDEIYGTIYDLLGRDADPAKLDAIEQAALMAGLLRDARELQTGATGGSPTSARADKLPVAPTANLLDRVIAIGEAFADDPGAGELMPEVIFNLAVAHQHRGDQAEAVRRFLQVAQDYADFPDAPRAAVLAVQIAYELRSGRGSGRVHLDAPTNVASPLVGDDVGTPPTRGDATKVHQDAPYIEALATLVTRFGGDPAARYWRFFYAQALEDAGRYRTAADQYLLVDPLHERALEAMCFRARSLASALWQESARDAEAVVAIRREASEIFDLLRDFSAQATQRLARASGEQRNELLRLVAESRLIAARTHLLPQLRRPRQALETLAGFEESYPQAKHLAGRVLSIRLRALEQLGRFEEAADVLPQYLEADGDHAAATLQTLYLALSAEVERLQESGRRSEARPRAELAVRLARHIYDWASHSAAGREAGATHRLDTGATVASGAAVASDAPAGRPTVATSDRLEGKIDLRAVKLQLAEALLLNDEPAQARVLFEECGAKGSPPPLKRWATPPPGDARAVMGLAQSLFQLGEYDQALPLFNKLAMALPAEEPLRWKALLRDLQCRSELKHDPRGIIKAIQNQQANPHYTDPKSGGRYATELEGLLRDCRRRTADEHRP